MKYIRILLKVLGILTAIVLLLLIWGLERVDDTPYFNAGYYINTMEKLDSLSGSLSLAEGTVQAGFGRAGITPGTGAAEDDPVSGVFREVPLAGYGDREGEPAEGVHDSLFVKAVAIQTGGELMVLVAADMLIVPPHISKAVGALVEERTGIPRSRLFFSATHTHSGVGAWSEGVVGETFAGPYNPYVSEWLTGQFSRAIELAVLDLKAGKLGTGSFEAPGLISNRLVGEKGQKNSAFVYMVVKQEQGRSAILGSYSAHATTMGGDNMLFSADYPGYWQRKMENAGYDLALFFAGSVGSHRPAGKGEGFEKARFIGEALADTLRIHAETTVLSTHSALACMTLEMELPEMYVRVTDGLRLRPFIAGKLFPPMGEVYIQAARIGELIWCTAPCDFSGELAIGYANAMYRKGYKSLVTSFNGAYTGYIIPGKYYHLNEYESRLMSWFGPYMGPYTDELIRRMMDVLVRSDL